MTPLLETNPSCRFPSLTHVFRDACFLLFLENIIISKAVELFKQERSLASKAKRILYKRD